MIKAIINFFKNISLKKEIDIILENVEEKAIEVRDLLSEENTKKLMDNIILVRLKVDNLIRSIQFIRRRIKK